MTATAKMPTKGLETIEQRIRQRQAFLREGVRPILEQCADEMVAEMEGNIESFTPGRVKDLAPSTKKQKQRDVGSVYPILLKTGQMVSSMYSQVVRVASVWRIRLGFSGQHSGGISNAALAQIHIKGTRASASRIKSLTQGLRNARNANRVFGSKAGRADVKSRRAELAAARSGIPARDFTTIKKATQKSWVTRIRKALQRT